MPLTSFCGLLTLQVGVAILSAIFLTLAGIILVANVFNYENHLNWPINLTLLILFVIMLIIAALLMFSSSYAESRSLAIGSLIVIVILTCYWIILSIFSFVNDITHVNRICISQRCPESFWIARLPFRKYIKKNQNQTYAYDQQSLNYDNSLRDEPYDTIQYDVTYGNKENINEVIKRVFSNRYGQVALKDDVYPSNDGPSDQSDYDTYGNAENGDYKNKMGWAFVGSIILFVINLVFLLFAAVVMWSWAAELDWADYYIEDEPVVVYEEPYVEPY